MQRDDVTNNTDCVFRVVCVECLEVNSEAVQFKAVKSQFSVGDSHGKFVVEEELKVRLWRLTRKV
jgi:hypothetical protein